MNAPFPRPGILEITPYQAGESKIAGKTTVMKLASNESPLGPSPAVAEALKAGFDTLQLYPDPTASALREALAAKYGVPAEQILCTSGSEQALHLVTRAYASLGDEVLFSQYGFIAYPIAAKAAGATPVIAPEQNFTTDIDALIARVSARTKVLFLANPNNPTGTYLPLSEIRRLHAALPERVLLVLDEAYAEYVTRDDYQSALALVKEGAPNVMVSRTFSKIYGLAAMRVGWSVCPPAVIDVFNRIRETFNVGALSQRAALAALADEAHVKAARDHNAKWLAWISDELTKLGLKVTPSIGNFLLVHFSDADAAKAADQHLRGDGIIVRPVAGYGLPQCLRISVGKDSENKALVESLRRFMGK